MDGSTGSAFHALLSHFPHDIYITEFRACDLTHMRDRIFVHHLIRIVNDNIGFLFI